jgi:serine-type D-Ala-D-Ala carboxypeptidase/endopeptidase
MTCRRIAILALVAASASIVQAATVPPDREIGKLIEDRVGMQRWATGIVVGITSPQGRRVLSHGTFAVDDPRRVDGQTVFEVASLTKIFTALLLADMAQQGRIALNDPAAKCLPAEVTLPVSNGRQITFADLATHTSGLPLRPTNLASQSALDRYAGYTVTQMYAALSSYTLESVPGARFEYSNWGYGLLGHALAGCAGKEYATLLEKRITTPLAMHDTVFRPTAAMKRRLAGGHDHRLTPVANQSFGALDPAGGLYSTADDLLTFLEALLGRKNSALAPAMSQLTTVHRPTDEDGTQIALGWRISTQGTQRIIWSNGRANGYRSYMAYDPDAAIGVVAFANAATNIGVDDIGLFALDSKTQPVRARRKVELAATLLDRYVGRYRFDDGVVFTITRSGAQLISQMTGQEAAPLYATAEREFYPEEIEARIVFDAPLGGQVAALTLQQDGQSWRAVRMEK